MSTYEPRNKRIIEVETGKEVLAKFNKDLVYISYCDCCGKHSSIEYKNVRALNTTSIWTAIHTALKRNRSKTIHITFPYLDENNELKFK